MLAKGGCVGYWQGEIPKVLADIGACRPTLFCGVPRVFDRIHAGICDQLAASWLKRMVFWFCMARKRWFMQRDVKFTVVRGGRAGGSIVDEAGRGKRRGCCLVSALHPSLSPTAHARPQNHHWTSTAPQASPLADLLVFNNIKQKLGGRVRLILSGAAPLAPPVQEFLAVAMCAPVLQVRIFVHGPPSVWRSSSLFAPRQTLFRAPTTSSLLTHLHPSPGPNFQSLPQGYGLTESCAATCIAEPFKWHANGTVGPPLPGVQVCAASMA
jgi:long-subunit acyl-CoA synthetase (AMP-forming)